MPSIAQQDYLRPQGKSLNDCHLLAALAHNIQQGTIFDTIIDLYEGGDKSYSPIIGHFPDSQSLFFYDATAEEIQKVSIPYTQTQYEGLAAIQDKQEGGYDQLPSLTKDSGHLYDYSLNGMYICIGGKYREVTTDGNQKIASLVISDESAAPDTYIDISWDDAQKLIGLPIE